MEQFGLEWILKIIEFQCPDTDKDTKLKHKEH